MGHLSYILGRKYISARFVTTDINVERKVGLLRLPVGEISQFHQGAGEDTTLDLIQVLQSIPKYSLVIIDEIEASLHPKAQRRLVRFLLKLSRQKRLQVILSTHSPYVLEELPEEARILLIPSPLTDTGPDILYGVSPEFAMTRIDDRIHPEAFVYVEDKISSIWLREIIASHPDADALLSRIQIYPVGPANVVITLGKLAAEKKLPHKAAAVLDGDMESRSNCILLPGRDAPEQVVFRGLQNASWPNLPERFGIGAGLLIEILEDAMREPDHHMWPEIVGNRVHKGATSVWEILATEWSRACLDDNERNRIYEAIKEIVDG